MYPATVANSGVESQGRPRSSTIHGSPPPTAPPPHEKLLNLQLGPGPGPGPRGTSPPLDATAQQPLPQARSHGGGRGGGGAQPPWKNLSPPRRPVPFAVTIGIEVYPPPPGILSAPPPANDTWLRRCSTPEFLFISLLTFSPYKQFFYFHGNVRGDLIWKKPVAV